MMKLVIVGSPTCRPCVTMKNLVLDKINDLQRMETSFEYIDLSELEDKWDFVNKHDITSTPTVWIQKDGETVKEFTGYVDIDTLFETIGEIKECV